jgi:hypothetical protein
MCILALAPAAAGAQPARSPEPATRRPAPTATKPRPDPTASAQRLAQLTAQRAQLARRYQEQLAAVDRLKKQKPSWRRDRELNAAQADAKVTADKLTVLDSQLVALRGQLAPPRAPKKIVIPDAELDPLADPQELEQQAAAIRAIEQQLERERRGLEVHAQELAHVAELRKAHDRAGDLATRDDDQPHRNAQRGGARTAAADESSSPSPQSGGSGGSPPGGDPSPPGDTDSFGGGDRGTGGAGSFESVASIVLGEVIDRSTIDGLVRASRSGNPAQRARAAKQARDAVAKRLEQLKKKREQIEQRARQLREQQ